MILRVPVTASNIVEWVRRAADAINALIRGHQALVAADEATDGRLGALEAEDVALDGRVGALEAFAATPFTLAAVVFDPIPLPGSPITGQTVMDQADSVLKTWDGSGWRAHW